MVNIYLNYTMNIKKNQKFDVPIGFFIDNAE